MMVFSNVTLRIISALAAIAFLTFIYTATPTITTSVLLACLFAWIIGKEWPLFFKMTSWQFWVYGALYLGLPLYALIYLNQSEHRVLLPLACLLTFSADAGAYFFGKTWGKKKLCPTISPNKTWVGLIGGYITTYTVLLAYQLCTRHTPLTLVPLLVLSCIVTTLAVTGDLFESWLKRKVDIKDSGSFLPGHGGALDRIDSLLPVSILFCVAHSWIIQVLR